MKSVSIFSPRSSVVVTLNQDIMSVPLVRVVTWNVADNTEMKAGFTNRAIDKACKLLFVVTSL